MQPRNLEALRFFDEKIVRHLSNRSDAEPSAENAWHAMHANYLKELDKKPSRLGVPDAFFLASQTEAIVIAKLAITPPGITLFRPPEGKAPSPTKTMVEWVAAQPKEAYPILVYTQDKATDDGLLNLRLSYSPSAIHICRSKNPACVDFDRIVKAKQILDRLPPKTKWQDLPIYLGLEPSEASEALSKRIEKNFSSLSDEDLRTIPAVTEPEYEFLSLLMSTKETYR